MLRMPVAGEPTPPLVAKNRKIAPVSLPESFQRAREKEPEPVPASDRGEKKKRRREPKTDQEQPDWDKKSESRGTRTVKKHHKPSVGKWVAISAITLLLIGGAGYYVVSNQPEGPIVSSPVVVAPPPVPAEPEQEKIDLPLEMNRNEAELLAELEPITQKFLDATTVDEILPLIRSRELVEPKIRKMYPDGKITAVGMSKFNTSGSIAYREKLASVSVRTRDFEMKQIAYLRTADGMKIDWESYVGWSEMPWGEFIDKKITKPALFRASLKLVEYYNFSFKDDRKWQSYQLRSPDGEQVVYAYVKRDSAIDKKIRPADALSTQLVTVRLKFQPDEVSKNQVLIEEVTADGWVEGVDAK